MRIVITGARGNVGNSLYRKLTHESKHESNAANHHVVGTATAADARHALDITDMEGVSFLMSQFKPDLVIHCAALTNVDQCAQDPDLALRINAIGTQNIALACQKAGAAMCYLSTNEVFDGTGNHSYMEYDPPHPANPYGYSKWVGEQMVTEVLPRHFIVRTAWVFAHTGNNFVQKIAARAQSGEPLSVVVDEIGSPTYAEDLTDALIALIQTRRYGTYHLVNEGSASRYEFARHILDCHGLDQVSIAPLLQKHFDRPSTPPPYSPLRNFTAAQLGIKLRPWREAVKAFVEHDSGGLHSESHVG